MNTRSSIIFRYHGIEVIAKCFLMGSLAERGIKLYANVLKEFRELSSIINVFRIYHQQTFLKGNEKGLVKMGTKFKLMIEWITDYSTSTNFKISFDYIRFFI